jgi:long-chain acyl-CoA synthetase
VREFGSPPTLAPPRSGSLTDDLLANAAEAPDAIALSRREGPRWVGMTCRAFLEDVRSVARGLLAAGVGSGDRVALLCATRYEWTLVDYALWYVGAVTVPVYESASPEQVSWVLRDSGARAAVVGTPAQRSLVERVAAEDGGRRLLATWVVETGAVEELAAAGRLVDDAVLEARRAAVTPDSLATLVYTSGTMGRPRGCMLTHGGFMVEAGAAVEELDALFSGEDPSTLLFLPLAHVLARVVQVGAVKARVRLGHSSEARSLLSDLESFRPTFLLGVPRVFEKVFNTASQRATADGRARAFDRSVRTAIAVSRARDDGRPGPLLRLRHRLAERLVYARVRESLGGRCRYAVSGGAPLGERLGHFYRGVGITVLEGYGLTETTAAVTLNRPDAVKIGTVGRPLQGVTVRVADDGELQVRGGQVFRGYWNDEKATADAFAPGGWLRTGDVGEIDDEGFVRVTGRKKEIIVTAGGKNVSPVVLEDGVRAHPLVSQCMVVGDGRPFVAALVTLDGEAADAWARAHGGRRPLAELAGDPALRAEVQRAVDEANRAVSQAEAVRQFLVLPVDWTEEGGQLTPSLKLRRTVVLHQFRGEIEAMYAR